MGTDIEGWVEVRNLWDETLWLPVIQIWPLLGRDYAMFGSLFGARNLAGFRPIAPERGIPADVSEQVKNEYTAEHTAYPQNILWPSWITWKEIKAIDWEEGTEQGGSSVCEYRKEANGEYKLVSRFFDQASSVSWLAQKLALGEEELLAAWEEGKQWAIGENLYRVEKVRRRDGLGNDWKTLFRN